mgnify:CR=1 FL=1
MKKLILLLLFIPLVTFSQDKFTGLSGYLKVTEDNFWMLSFQNNAYKQLRDWGTISFNNKIDAEEFVRNYIDCVNNIKTIKRKDYTISSNKRMVIITNSDGQYTMAAKKYTKKGIKEMQESLKYME